MAQYSRRDEYGSLEAVHQARLFSCFALFRRAAGGVLKPGRFSRSVFLVVDWAFPSHLYLRVRVLSGSREISGPPARSLVSFASHFVIVSYSIIGAAMMYFSLYSVFAMRGRGSLGMDVSSQQEGAISTCQPHDHGVLQAVTKGGV